ncbi:MAG: lipopolysaccharide heptosyltransferase II [Isosphaerales bacterium]
MKIAVFCPNLIGDTVMATPTLRAFRGGFPGATIAGVIKTRVAPTLEGTPWFDELIRFDPNATDRSERTMPVVRRLRRGRFDVAVLLPNSFRSALIAWLADIPRRVGYVRSARGFLLTDRLHAARDASGRRLPTPVLESYLQLARRLGCPVDSVQIELATTMDDEAAADQAWRALGLKAGERVVCFNTGGAFGPAKSWPTQHFAVLARRLAGEADVPILVLCGPDERGAAREIVQLAGHPRVVSLADQPLGIGLTKACVRRSALLITTDSGPRHFAAAFNTPVITLFGPTHIAWTRTYHPHAWHLFHPVPCGPCQRPVCPEGHHRCMRELSPESVFRTALRALETEERVAPTEHELSECFPK